MNTALDRKTAGGTARLIFGAAIVAAAISGCGGNATRPGGSGASSAGTFVDSRDGKTYRVAKIGERVWMAENLNFHTENSRCLDDKDANCQKYGRLYNWDDAKGACPAGWRLPSDEEWQSLYELAGDYETAAKRLKSKSGWVKNGNGTDDFGFSALPSGWGRPDGGFGFDGSRGFWWSVFEGDGAAIRSISKFTGNNVEVDPTYLHSVRCVEETEEERTESRTLEETIVKVITAWQKKDEKTLNGLLIKDFGIAKLEMPGIAKFLYVYDKISLDSYPYMPDNIDYKIKYEEAPGYDCDSEKWSKPFGIYVDTANAGGALSGYASMMNQLVEMNGWEIETWPAEKIKQFEEIDKNSQGVTIVYGGNEAFGFYLTFWENKWRLTAIDRIEYCSA